MKTARLCCGPTIPNTAAPSASSAPSVNIIVLAVMGEVERSSPVVAEYSSSFFSGAIMVMVFFLPDKNWNPTWP